MDWKNPKPLTPDWGLPFTWEFKDEDYPLVLFFQGVQMPKWAGYWPGIPDYKKVDITHYYDIDSYLDHVYGRIDHDNLESEEAPSFILAAQRTLESILERPDAFERKDWSREQQAEIRTDVVEGLCQMIQLAEGEEVVFWTNGLTKDLEPHLEAIRRFRLGPGHPEYLEPPHRFWRRLAVLRQLDMQRDRLRDLVNTLPVDKNTQVFVQGLNRFAE